MKTREELNALKKEVEALNQKLAELTEEELTQIAGGISGISMAEGTAGAYGGSDDSGKTTTATGEIVDDCSMGVAIPMSWPNSRLYLGKTILINYGGMMVLAKINDIGALIGRDLDLQPGVFRSFEFKSCADWGIRSISYRVL